MKPVEFTVKLSKQDHECVEARCLCLYEVTRKADGKLVAACTTHESLYAVLRLFI